MVFMVVSILIGRGKGEFGGDVLFLKEFFRVVYLFAGDDQL